MNAELIQRWEITWRGREEDFFPSSQATLWSGWGVYSTNCQDMDFCRDRKNIAVLLHSDPVLKHPKLRHTIEIWKNSINDPFAKETITSFFSRATSMYSLCHPAASNLLHYRLSLSLLLLHLLLLPLRRPTSKRISLQICRLTNSKRRTFPWMTLSLHPFPNRQLLS